MTLRARLALALVLTTIPLTLTVAWARRELTRRSEVQALRDLVLSRLNGLGRERCESAPEELLRPPRRGPARPPGEGPGMREPAGSARPGGGPPPHEFGPPPHERGLGPPGRGPLGPPPRVPVEAYAYDAQFRAAQAEVPVFPAELQRALASGETYASRRVRLASQAEGLELAVRTGWNEGGCAVVLARWAERGAGESWAFLSIAVPLLAVALACVLVAAGPVVRRIRALTIAVGQAADTQYALPIAVDGRDEIADLARAFNEAGTRLRDKLAALEQRDQTLRAFLANTTHDVMIPLTVLQGHLSDLRGRLAHGPEQDASLVAAMQEAQYLSSLLHNLAAAAKLETGEPLVEFHPLDLSAVVERVVARHRPVAGPAGVAIEFGVPARPVVVDGDVTLIEQAVSNLVHNAVRYNRSGGHVAVLLEDASPSSFRLRVLDDGPGVAEEDLAHLLERGRRSQTTGDDPRQRQQGGLGLGLHIVHTVALRHGFELRLERSEHGGLEVTLAGPARPLA